MTGFKYGTEHGDIILSAGSLNNNSNGDGDICCRAFRGCYDASNIINNNLNGNITCHGFQSCFNGSVKKQF